MRNLKKPNIEDLDDRTWIRILSSTVQVDIDISTKKSNSYPEADM